MQPLYLVTGAAGHLGNTVIQGLLKEGAAVRALVLPHELEAARRILGTKPELIPGNVTDEKSLEPFFTNPERAGLCVIHCAGVISITSSFDPLVYNVNVNGTRNIINLCKQHEVSKLVYISSVHAIPELPHGKVISEADKFSPDDVFGLYAKTKAEATQLVLEAANKGLNACIVHPAGIIGPYDFGNGHGTQIVLDYLEGRLNVCVQGGYDFVDVRDVADGILACCKNGKRGECYILSNNYYPVKEILDSLHEISDKRRIKTMLPLWLVRLFAPIAEIYYKLKKQTPLFTRYSIYTLQSNSLFSHDKATRELGYNPRPIKQTLLDTVQWLKTQGRIGKPLVKPRLKKRVRFAAN